MMCVVGAVAMLVACGSGGGGDQVTWNDYITPPSPYPKQGTYIYNGSPVSYTDLPAPSILQNPYPSSYFPTGLSNGLQIAYGESSEINVSKIAAYVHLDLGTQRYGACSATPVYYDANSGTTFLVSAAHCFAIDKNKSNVFESDNMYPISRLKIYEGTNCQNTSNCTPYNVKAIYIQSTYCYGSTFPIWKNGQYFTECTLFSPTDGIYTQGNDIALIQIESEFGGVGNHTNYPLIATSSQYPQTYTMAPIFSIGYGKNTQAPSPDSGLPFSQMYYVAGYQYWQQDATGYHYLYNSFYNTNIQAPFSVGYSSLICGGDSGGPDLFWTGSKWILLSEHTYGPSGQCGTFFNYLPNGATNVSAYYDWLQSIMNNPDPVNNCKNNTITNCVTNG